MTTAGQARGFDGYMVPISDEIANKLDVLRLSGLRRRLTIERAINAALDEACWPSGPRGGLAIKSQYWYVILHDKRTGEMRGHVGPIDGDASAHKICASWRQAGWPAVCSRNPVGPAMTNAFGRAEWP